MAYLNSFKLYRRRLLQKLFDAGESDTEIAHLTEYSESWIRTLRTKYEKEGINLLELHKPGGSVCRLNAAQLSRLRLILDEGAESYGLEGAFWDRKRVKYVIEQEFSIHYDIEHISDILAKLNYTLQKPVKKDFRQSADKVQVWIDKTLPEIKKK
jgi:transposase